MMQKKSKEIILGLLQQEAARLQQVGECPKDVLMAELEFLIALKNLGLYETRPRVGYQAR